MASYIIWFWAFALSLYKCTIIFANVTIVRQGLFIIMKHNNDDCPMNVCTLSSLPRKLMAELCVLEVAISNCKLPMISRVRLVLKSPAWGIHFTDRHTHTQRQRLFVNSTNNIWVSSRNYCCLVTWFCYQLIAKPDKKTAAVSWHCLYKNNGILFEKSDVMIRSTLVSHL